MNVSVAMETVQHIQVVDRLGDDDGCFRHTSDGITAAKSD